MFFSVALLSPGFVPISPRRRRCGSRGCLLIEFSVSPVFLIWQPAYSSRHVMPRIMELIIFTGKKMKPHLNSPPYVLIEQDYLC